MSGPVHSTGRGGAGNIGEDSNVYTDAGIVREGPYGESARPGGDVSVGRGGAGNIQHDVSGGANQTRRDDEIVPETNIRDSDNTEYGNFHTGRGGQGNVHKDKYGGHSSKKEQEEAEGKQHEGMGDKVKKALHMDK